MRVLCCLDGTNAEQVAKAAQLLSAHQPPVLTLLHVIDDEPRTEIGRLRERFFRRSPHQLPHEKDILESEKSASKEILNAGVKWFGEAETIEREGRPGHEIVNVAAEWRADVVVICARAQYGGRASIGPKSVGHVARFVLDHAPCPVLLVREALQERFPL
jgi:nucleotide-binding universal stress UspA family protein